MTYAEAHQDMTNYYACGCYNGNNGLSFETMIKAINALLKQVPLKPRNVDYAEGDFDCPACGAGLYVTSDVTDMKYCMNCGQAFEWDNDDK